MMFDEMLQWLNEQSTLLLILGVMVIASLFFSILLKKIKLPSIVGYMLMGILLGPSVLGLLSEELLSDMAFLTKLILAFVAFKIGLEIDLRELKIKGKLISILTISILFGCIFFVVLGVYLLTGELGMAVFLGAIAPASAPAGTMAVIEEYRASGSLTHTLKSIVGIDDGLGIIVFGLLMPVGVYFISSTAPGYAHGSLLFTILKPIAEVVFSIVLGWVMGRLFILFEKNDRNLHYAMIITFGFVTLTSGIAQLASLSYILTNMVFGLTVGNDHKHHFMKEIDEKDVGLIMPLFYLIFFTIAGANLHVKMLPELGLIGIIYILGRFAGKYGGAYIGARLGKAEPKIRKYLGLGIMSQAGVAIGLALVVKQEVAGLGNVIGPGEQTLGDYVGSTVFTTITATSVFFELLGPLLARHGLKKAGETNAQ